MTNVTTRTRRTAFGLATLAAVAATAITIPLVSQPAPAQAAFGGCSAAPATLLIEKTDPAGNPLAGATFAVDAQHWGLNSPLSPGFERNPLHSDYAAASAVSDQARQAADEARTVLHDAQAAQAALDDLLAEASAQSPELAALYKQESAQSLALGDARVELAAAEEHLTAAEWGGDSNEIAAAQEAFDAATQAVADAEAALAETRAEIDALIAYVPSADEIADARTALTAATEATDQAAADYDVANQAFSQANRATEGVWIDAHEQVTSSAVSTGEDGRATVEVVGFARCVSGSAEAPNIDRAENIAPIVTEIKAPGGYRLDSTPHAAEQLDDGSLKVTVVNEPEEPEIPLDPAQPSDEQLVQTGTDLTAPLTFGALLTAAGGVLASGPLLRRVRRRSL